MKFGLYLFPEEDRSLNILTMSSYINAASRGQLNSPYANANAGTPDLPQTRDKGNPAPGIFAELEFCKYLIELGGKRILSPVYCILVWPTQQDLPRDKLRDLLNAMGRS